MNTLKWTLGVLFAAVALAYGADSGASIAVEYSSTAVPVANTTTQTTTDSVVVPTMEAHRKLAARVTAIEALLQEPDKPTRPQRPSRPDGRPTEPDRPTNQVRGPPISIQWRARNGTPTEFVLGKGELSTKNHDGLQFRVYSQKVETLDAWMITVAVINGYSDRGPAYFEAFRIASKGEQLEQIQGKHVILPRGAILRRFWLGSQAQLASTWAWATTDKPVPVWANDSALAALAKPWAIKSGPYRFYWPDRSLSNTHGGQGIGPFHGGPDDWLATPDGRRLREKQMLAAYQRPVWLLGETPQEPYWMGRTDAHKLQGYNGIPDDWCSYAEDLADIRFADHTHLTRCTAGPAAIARWDNFAKDCLRITFKDFETAHSLTRPVESSLRLLWPLWKKIEVADGPYKSEGTRGLAHRMRLLRWCRPYIEAEILAPYEEALRQWTRKMAHPDYGYTHTNSDNIRDGNNNYEIVLDAPTIQTFHQQLNSFEFQLFGGLEDIALNLNTHLTAAPPWFFEARDGLASDTCLDRKGFKNGYAAYGSMTHKILMGYSSPENLLFECSGRSANGSSQDLDNVPPSLWESEL